MKFFDRKQSRLVDAIAIERFGIPGIVLMENAGRTCAEYLLANTNGPVLICCGAGNNGGDGFVIARHLENAGQHCSIVFAGDESRLAGDAAVNFQIIKAMRIPFAQVSAESSGGEVEAAMTVDGDDPDIVVDALLGTGATGNPREPFNRIIQSANRMPAARIAIDIPTGLDCDTGEIGTPAFLAHATLTFVTQKTGFQNPEAARCTGTVHVIDIGVPREVVDLVESDDS